MAQLTRSGHVYVISNLGSFGENVFKIGMTRRLEPMDRIRELGDASVPFDFDVHAMIYCEDAPSLECAFQARFEGRAINLVNPRKEFFAVSIEQIEAVVREKGLNIELTKLAEARDLPGDARSARRGCPGAGATASRDLFPGDPGRREPERHVGQRSGLKMPAPATCGGVTPVCGRSDRGEMPAHRGPRRRAQAALQRHGCVPLPSEGPRPRRGGVHRWVGPRAAPGCSLALVVYLDRPAGLPEEPAILRESLLIGGWVAMWRPLEVFLYDWWPIRLEARLYDRLSAMPVRIAYKDDTKPEAWRSDWPVTSRSVTTSDDKPSAPEPGTATHA